MYVWVSSFYFKQKNKTVIIVKLFSLPASAICKKMLLCKHFYQKLLTPGPKYKGKQKILISAHKC